MNEKENTFRVLKDLPPAVTSIRCSVGWHTWTKWSQGVVVNSYAGTYRLSRYCIHCNMPSDKIYTIKQ